MRLVDSSPYSVDNGYVFLNPIYENRYDQLFINNTLYFISYSRRVPLDAVAVNDNQRYYLMTTTPFHAETPYTITSRNNPGIL